MALPSGYDETPTVAEFFRRVYAYFDEMVLNSDQPVDYQFVLQMTASVRLTDILIVLLIATGLTLLRVLMTEFVSIPLAMLLQISESNKPKWPETLWKGLVYSVLWLQTLYVVVLSGRYDLLHNSLNIFQGFEFGESQLHQPVPSDMYWIYAMQLGFYVHSVFGTLFMDPWRKDSVMMLLHHALTILLLELSFLARYYKIGALVLVLHDMSDILLEFTKINHYLKDRGQRLRPVHEWLANIGVTLFSASWAFFRLYWFPLKVIHSSTWGVYVHHRGGYPRLFLLFNSMLLTLQALHILWFQFILILLYRIATGQQRGLEDTREFRDGAMATTAKKADGEVLACRKQKAEHTD